MNRGTKIYTVILGVITLSLAVLFLYETPKVREINNQLKSIAEINDFPYQFKVLRINNGVAILNSPISTELPCGKVIGVIFPSLKGKSLLSPEYQTAQKSLAKVQMQVGNTVKSYPGIKSIIWELDRSWIIQNGISFNNL